MIYLFSLAEALVLRSGVLTHKSMYIDGILLYLFLSDRAVLFFFFVIWQCNTWLALALAFESQIGMAVFLIGLVTCSVLDGIFLSLS